MKKQGKSCIKNLRYLCLAGVIALGLIAIVGSNGAEETSTTTYSGDTSSGNGEGGGADESEYSLTADDINAIGSALTAATNAVWDEYRSNTSSRDLEPRVAVQIAIDVGSTCEGGGRITASGNITVTVDEDTGESTTFGQITIQVSDPANNLNDCHVGGGVILDGTLFLTISGTDSDITLTLDGTIGINYRGSDGGLVPITDDCSIFIIWYPDGSGSGSICGHSVSGRTMYLGEQMDDSRTLSPERARVHIVGAMESEIFQRCAMILEK